MTVWPTRHAFTREREEHRQTAWRFRRPAQAVDREGAGRRGTDVEVGKTRVRRVQRELASVFSEVVIEL